MLLLMVFKLEQSRGRKMLWDAVGIVRHHSKAVDHGSRCIYFICFPPPSPSLFPVYSNEFLKDSSLNLWITYNAIFFWPFKKILIRTVKEKWGRSECGALFGGGFIFFVCVCLFIYVLLESLHCVVSKFVTQQNTLITFCKSFWIRWLRER